MSHIIPLQQQAYDNLKEMIVNERLKYGKIYSERQISEQMYISRTPFREALQRLSQDGYVDILPQRGFMLHPLTKEDVVSIYQMRTAIESYCLIQYAMDAGSDKVQSILQQLEDCARRQDSCLEQTPDFLRYVDLDCEFHRIIVFGLGNALFEEAFERYAYRLFRITRMTLTLKERLECSTEEHRAIIDIVRRGQHQQVYQWLFGHIHSSMRVALELMEQQQINQ